MRVRDSAGHVRAPVDGYRCTVGECRQWSPASEWDMQEDGGGACPTCLTIHAGTLMAPERRWLKVAEDAAS